MVNVPVLQMKQNIIYQLENQQYKQNKVNEFLLQWSKKIQ
jgi:hypothetical protein